MIGILATLLGVLIGILILSYRFTWEYGIALSNSRYLEIHEGIHLETAHLLNARAHDAGWDGNRRQTAVASDTAPLKGLFIGLSPVLMVLPALGLWMVSYQLWARFSFWSVPVLLWTIPNAVGCSRVSAPSLSDVTLPIKSFRAKLRKYPLQLVVSTVLVAPLVCVRAPSIVDRFHRWTDYAWVGVLAVAAYFVTPWVFTLIQ